jgi:NAD(P)-dependent dehydrogenase (short-subunit alcohol dehydrogenase family)
MPADRPAGIFAEDMLADRVAIVTGGGSGVGRQTALQLAACGARVVVCGRRREPLQETAALQPDGRVEAAELDIRDADRVDDLIDSVLAGHGAIDLLVKNAGGQFLSPAELISPKGFETVVRLNLIGSWNVTHSVATKAMIPDARGGKIISITLTPHNGLPGMAHSSASRAAVENLMRVLAIEWARFGIRLNSVALGPIGTDTFMTKYPKQVVESTAAAVPLQTIGNAEDIAAMIAFLASPHGDFITGATLTVDGGMDNWVGAWPPQRMADEQGKPLIEERRSRPAGQ